jgi:broad specificity phosphatase PhoE
MLLLLMMMLLLLWTQTLCIILFLLSSQQQQQPVILELERQTEPLLIVAHQAVLRCLYAYFLDLPADEIPFLSIPLHTLIRLEVRAYGCREKRVRIIPSDEPSMMAVPITAR